MAVYSLRILSLLGTLLTLTVWQAASLCIFGDGPDCFMKCHCSGMSTTECNKYTGRCSSGCAKIKPDVYKYTGPSCQLGNVAYKKNTFSNSVINKTTKNYNRPHLWYNTNNTVDGLMTLRVFDGSCAVIYTAKKTTLPWMMVDLGDMYIITKITLVNTDNSIDASYLENFNVKIGNTSNIDDQQLCKKWSTRIRSGGKQFITCDNPIYGRYVSLKKYSERNKVGRLPLCEIIVWGYNHMYVEWDSCLQPSSNHIWCTKCNGKIPPDCTKSCPDNSYGDYCEGICGHCFNGTKCNKADGACSKCELGWKPPKCDVPCPNNTYGISCEYRCGKCMDQAQCHFETGNCPGQCQLWYADEDKKCKTYIPRVNVDEQPTVLFRGDTWAVMSLRLDYSYQLSQYYMFKLYYIHENDPLATYQDYTNYTIHYDNVSHIVKIQIDSLLPDTQYWFAVQVIRTHRNQNESGIQSSPVHFVTRIDDGRDDEPKPTDRPEELPSTNPATTSKGSEGLNNQPSTPGQQVITTKGTPQKPLIPAHHTSILTVVLSIVILIIVMAIGIAIGIYFWKKHQRREPKPLTIAQKDTDNVCYSSQADMLKETDDDYAAFT